MMTALMSIVAVVLIALLIIFVAYGGDAAFLVWL